MRIKIILIVLLTFFHLVTFTCGTLIRITGVECHVVDPTFCRYENCVMKPVSRGVKELSMVVRMLQLPVTNISIRAEILRRGYSTQSLYQFDIDGCQFWINKRRNPVAQALYKFLRLGVHSNINHTCPYNHDLVLDHLQIDKNVNLPLPIGKGDYAMKSYWRAYNVLRFIFTVNMQVTD